MSPFREGGYTVRDLGGPVLLIPGRIPSADETRATLAAARHRAKKVRMKRAEIAAAIRAVRGRE